MTSEKTGSESKLFSECPICLEALVYPCKLPCDHVFCFLCIKGFLNTQNSRCALCRTEIPTNYLENPNLILDENIFESSQIQSSISSNNSTEFEPIYVWYYEGRNGWWQYDDRTNLEIEKEFKSNKASIFELQIAGFLYSIDLDKKLQFRSDDPKKKRRIKRDLKYVNHTKGVAGLKGFVQSKHQKSSY